MRYIVVWLIILGPAATLFAQDPAYQIEQLQVPGGANANAVIDIAQDPERFMWFGTVGVLFRYDGYTFTNFAHDPADSTSLASDWVETVYMDREGTLWAGTYGGGLNRFDPETESFTRYRGDPEDENSLSSDSVTVILEDRSGVL